MDDERTIVLEDKLREYETNIMRLQLDIEENRKLASLIREALAPVYLARWQARTGSTLAPGDRLLVTEEFHIFDTKHNGSLAFPLGSELFVNAIYFDWDTVSVQDRPNNGIGIWGVPRELVEGMRAAYLAKLREATE